MENTINFGIDLGTTNSAIAKFIKGEVIVFTNPQDYGRSTLPSVVSFKKDKILVGNKAKEFLEKDPHSVVGMFKRKMGTSESFKIKALNESKTPIDLSALVLKELKTFVNTNDQLDAVVITIPASFDTIQSNATKESGLLAGFKQVVLLQEPIAASLAYANMKKEKDMQDSKWLVYDLGGGTFDVALIEIRDGEMKVIDHEGDNFLGGADFDQLIVERLIIPKITKQYSFSNLESDMKSASGKYNVKYYSLLRRAEEAKILLSAKTSSEIIVDGFEDEDSNEVDMEITITRSEFNELINPAIDETVAMIKRILTRNSINAHDIHYTLMVGGSTYIPYVRQRTEEVLQIPCNCEIDPTTAVAIGAAYYAATKQKNIESGQLAKRETKISIKPAYQKASKEKDELFAAKVSGDIDGLFYRIRREDGGFDTGLKRLTERINEDLPLVESAYNFFILTVYDGQNNVVETNMEMIGINSGFGISGQPLPEDICLEIDDFDNPGATKLELFFPKNTILPTTRKKTWSLNRTIIKGAEGEVRIRVLEGSHLALPSANKDIGCMLIKAKSLNRDISKGSDIEIAIAISESRDITISAYLNMSDQEFKETFNPKVRHTEVPLLQEEVSDLADKLEEEIEQATEKEDYETASTLTKLRIEMTSVSEETDNLTADDVTDNRYKLEDKKRKIAQEIDNATKNKRLQKAKEHYLETKQACEELIEDSGNDHERKVFNDIVIQEIAFQSTNSPIKIQEKADELHAIMGQIRWRTPGFLTSIFRYLEEEHPRMNEQIQSKSLIDAGKLALENQNWDRLREINLGLLDFLPKGANKDINTKIGFGF